MTDYMLDIVFEKIFIGIIWGLEFSCPPAVCPVEQFKDSSSQVHGSGVELGCKSICKLVISSLMWGPAYSRCWPTRDFNLLGPRGHQNFIPASLPGLVNNLRTNVVLSVGLISLASSPFQSRTDSSTLSH